MKFIQAKYWNWANRTSINLIVVHTMENPEKPGTADGVAAWFASDASPKASAHLCIDNLSVVECVKPEHVAWGAPSANRTGFHIEHAGRASQDASGWGDYFSESMLRLSAKAAAVIAVRYGIPLVHLTPAQIASGAKGFCGHIDVTHAFNTPGGHVDPGVSFPWSHYLELVQNEVAAHAEGFPL